MYLLCLCVRHGPTVGFSATPRQPGSPRWSGWPLASPSDGATLLLSTTGGDVPTLSASDPRRLSRPYRPRLRRHRLGAFTLQLDDDLSDEVELLSESDES